MTVKTQRNLFSKDDKEYEVVEYVNPEIPKARTYCKHNFMNTLYFGY